MSITIKQAYEIALDALEGFKINGCVELSDCWLFGWCHEDGTAILLPPIRISKETGEASLHDECGVSFLNNTCREKGTVIPLEDIENMP